MFEFNDVLSQFLGRFDALIYRGCLSLMIKSGTRFW